MSIADDLRRAQQEHRARDRAEDVTAEHFTDAGNAERLVRLHGEDLRYVHAWRRWLVFDGRRWALDETGEVMRRAKAAVASMYEDAARSLDGVRESLGKHALKSEHVNRLRAMVELAASEPGIALRIEDLDSDPWAFNVLNGTLDLRTGKLRAHRRVDLLTKLAPVEYQPDATAPIWTAFLERVMPDAEVRAFLRRAVGYSLTGSTAEQCMFLLWGSGANGKTTYLEAVRRACGDNALHTPADTLLARRDTGIPNDVARLRGARFVTAVETEESRRLAESRVKELTGGDTISARYMRGEWFEFQPVAKFWLGTNHKPAIKGTDFAIWRRIRLVPFTVTIADEEKDEDLPEKLRGELPGILAWAVEGCLEWQETGLRPPEAVLIATEGYRAEQDLVGAFVEECCVTSTDRTITSPFNVGGDALYGAYSRWCDRNNEDPLSQRSFGYRLSERGFPREKHGRFRRWHRFGIGLRAEDANP